MIRLALHWDEGSYEKLWEATKMAAEAGQEHFTVDLGRKKGRHIFGTEEALGLCETLSAQFKLNPMPVFGENREGKEP